MKRFFQYIKKMPVKAWIMALATIIGFACLIVSWIGDEGIVAVLSFVIAVVPAVIWFSDYKEYLSLQDNVNQLNGWRDDLGTEPIDNPEWARVITDAKDRWLFGIRHDGSVDWQVGIPGPIRDELDAIKERIAELEKDKE